MFSLHLVVVGSFSRVDCCVKSASFARTSAVKAATNRLIGRKIGLWMDGWTDGWTDRLTDRQD